MTDEEEKPQRKRWPTWLIVVVVLLGLAVLGWILEAAGLVSDDDEQPAVEQVVEPAPEPEPEPKQAPEPEEPEELKPSEEAAAYRAIRSYGERMYPYGFELHYLAGVRAERQLGPNEWFFKITCDVTNEYGATAKDLICDASLTRDGDNWTVTDFMVY